MDASSDVTQLLSGEEQFWRELQPWLQSCGYMLRPRYRPEWVPSWIDTNKQSMDCEDGQHYKVNSHSVIMDATRISDGKAVALKRVSRITNDEEERINKFFSSEPRASDIRNRCLPAFEVLEVPEREYSGIIVVIIVMPLVRPCDDPPFETIGEVVEFFRQIFEGIQFMHENGVAHRNLKMNNIMMDATNLYPDGYHPICLDMNKGFGGPAKHYTRTELPPSYYLSDFSLSRRFYLDESRPLALPLPVKGDKALPEFQGEGRYRPSNPFATDMYYLGRLIKNFMDHNLGFEFMSALVGDMMLREASARPTINEIAARFELVLSSLSESELQSKIVRRRKIRRGSWLRDAVKPVRRMINITKESILVPSTSQ